MSEKISHSKPEITAATFPALHTFLRGYFHEDVADEYGTPLEAAEQFCDDAETDERVAVAKEWTHLMQMLHGRPVAEINQALTAKLGGSVRLKEEEVQQVSEVFARCLAVKQKHYGSS
jgi:hypothetical protein